MNCLELRRALGADPHHTSPESLAHRATCPTCEKYAQEMLRLDGLIKRALLVPVRHPRPKRSLQNLKWYATAASVLLVVGIASALWLVYPRDSLANDVVAHMAHEPGAMSIDGKRVAAELLDGVLHAKGMHLKQPIDSVSYLESCDLRGHVVPHLVVQTGGGPVTVILLPEEKVGKSQRFDEQQFHGMLLPLERGGAAVLANDATLIDEVANRVKASIAFD